MSWWKKCFKLISFPITLWVTASVIFFLSRLLPGITTPKGMADADTIAYGSASQSIVAKIKAGYRQKIGLTLPFFYFSVSSTGKVASEKIACLPVDAKWARQAVQWHGTAPAKHFYQAWLARQKSSDAETRETILLLRNLLDTWSESTNAPQRLEAQRRFRAVLKKIDPKRPVPPVLSLLHTWDAMVLKRAPLSFLLPTIQWHGYHNQYHRWLTGTIQGNLGVSNRDYRPVIHKIGEALRITLPLGGLGFIFALLFSSGLGLLLARFPQSSHTQSIRQLLYILDSVPAFLLALTVLALFLTAGGRLVVPMLLPTQAVLPFFFSFNTFLIASCCITLLLVPHLTLQFYQSLVQESSKLYTRTAQAKGLTPLQVLWKHVFPNALLPSLTLLSEILAGLLAGVLVIEITFSLPGIGSLLTQSILTNDHPVLIGITLLLLSFRMGVVWLTDLIQTKADPRIRIV